MTKKLQKSDRVVRDGKVAVIISPGYGAGWWTWNKECEALLFDPELVALVEKGAENNRGAILERAEQLLPGGYWGGLDQLKVEWVAQNTRFYVEEYDGSESIHTQDDDDFITA